MGVRGPLRDEFEVHAKTIDSTDSMTTVRPNTGGQSFPPFPSPERNIPRHDATSSRPYRPNFCV